MDLEGLGLAASALPFFVLAGFALLHGRGTPAVRAFGVTAIGIGLVLAAFAAWRLLGIVNPFEFGVRPLWPLAVLTAGAMILPVGFVWLALVSPAPIAPAERRLLWVPCAVGVSVFALILLVQLDGIPSDVTESGEHALTALVMVGYPAVFSTLAAALVLLALRAGEAAGGLREHALLSAGLVIFFVTDQAEVLLRAAREGVSAATAAAILGIGAVAVLWLRNAARATTTKDAASARNLVLVTLGGSLATVLVAAYGGTTPYLLIGLGFAVFAYAILRHQMLGLDLKVRWGLSRGTVAAVFIAAFFVASEGTQVVFGDDNPWFGVAAAGALVFALAPLQRLGDRLAERAVPVAEGAAPARAGDEEETYRVTLRKFLADGRVTREEERHLARLATRLGIDAERAHELREEVEAVYAGGIVTARTSSSEP